MSTPKPTRPRDQRRSRRYPARLRVTFQGKGGTHGASSLDVARHGLFISTPTPVRERHIVGLEVTLPKGVVRATALVTRCILKGPDSGMGVQFFALGSEDKQVWDNFMSAVEGHPSSAVEPSGQQVAVYLLKPRNLERLRAFYFDELAPGRMSLATPVLKDAGTEVALAVIHPNTQEEYPVHGVVSSVQRRPHKRMEIQFHRLGSEDLRTFQLFIDTGRRSPTVPTGSSPYLAPISDTPPPAAPSGTLATAEEADASGFEVDLEAGETVEDEHFSWEEVELEFASAEDERNAPWDEVPLEVGSTEPSIADAERHFTALAGELRKPSRTLRVACDSCGLPDASFTLGGAPGAAGLLVEMRPCWCERCGIVVTAPSLLSQGRRRHLRQRLQAAHPAALQAPVPAAVLFEMVDLLGPPRCTVCKGNLAVTDSIRALERHARGLHVGETATCHGAACPYCEKGTWVVRCVSGHVLAEDTFASMPPGDGGDGPSRG